MRHVSGANTIRTFCNLRNVCMGPNQLAHCGIACVPWLEQYRCRWCITNQRAQLLAAIKEKEKQLGTSYRDIGKNTPFLQILDQLSVIIPFFVVVKSSSFFFAANVTINIGVCWLLHFMTTCCAPFVIDVFPSFFFTGLLWFHGILSCF